MKVRIGAHNLHDQTGTVTFPASIMFFTEAIPARVKDALPDGWDMAACERQKDLVIAWDSRVFTPRSSRRARWYRRLVEGLAKVTPNRGTFTIYGTLDGRKTALVVSHRINAAFPPYKRGEGELRHAAWEKHTRADVRHVKRLKKRGYVVLAGGDLNAPPYVTGWRRELHEVSSSLDRLGASVPLSDFNRLSQVGSDHHRIVATAHL